MVLEIWWVWILPFFIPLLTSLNSFTIKGFVVHLTVRNIKWPSPLLEEDIDQFPWNSGNWISLHLGEWMYAFLLFLKRLLCWSWVYPHVLALQVMLFLHKKKELEKNLEDFSWHWPPPFNVDEWHSYLFHFIRKHELLSLKNKYKRNKLLWTDWEKVLKGKSNLEHGNEKLHTPVFETSNRRQMDSDVNSDVFYHREKISKLLFSFIYH